MDQTRKNMDETVIILENTLHWAGGVECLPVAFAKECRSRMLTAPRPYLEFYFQVEGRESTIRVGGRTAAVHAGEAVIMNAHFGNEGSCSSPWQYWCVSFNVKDHPKFDALGKSPLLLTVPVRDPAALAHRYAAVAREYATDAPWQAFRLKAVVLQFLVCLRENAVADSAAGRVRSRLVESALERIWTGYADHGLTLASLAEELHVSADHLGRFFRLDMGVPPMKYLTQYRVERARELMARGGLRVKEIAAEVGFADPLHFSRVFRRSLGASPRGYRQRTDSQTPRA